MTNVAKSLKKAGKSEWLTQSYHLSKIYAGVPARKDFINTELKPISEVLDDEVILGIPKSQVPTARQTKGFVNSIRKNNSLQAKYFFKQKKENSKGVERVALTVTEVFDTPLEDEVISLFNSKQKAIEFSSQSLSEQQAILGEIGRQSVLSLAQKVKLNYHVIVGKLKDYRETPLFSESTAKFFDKSSASFLSVMAFFYVVNKIDAIVEQIKKEDNADIAKYAEVGSALISVSYSLENVGRSFNSMDDVRAWYQQNAKAEKFMFDFSRAGFAFTPLSFLATLGSSIRAC